MDGSAFHFLELGVVDGLGLEGGGCLDHFHEAFGFLFGLLFAEFFGADDGVKLELDAEGLGDGGDVGPSGVGVVAGEDAEEGADG